MADTGPAKLPGIAPLQTSDPALAKWAQAVTEHLEVRNGGRGNPMEKTVTQRDLTDINDTIKTLNAPIRTPSPGDVVVDLGGGRSTSISIDGLVDSMVANAKFKQAITTTTPASSSLTSDPSADIARVEAAMHAGISALESRVADVSGVANDAAATARTAQALAKGAGAGGRSGLLYSGDLSYGLDWYYVARWAIWSITVGTGVPTTANDDHIVAGDTVALRVLNVLGQPTGSVISRRFGDHGWVDIGTFINGQSIAAATIPLGALDNEAGRRLDQVIGVKGNGPLAGAMYLSDSVYLGVNSDVTLIALLQALYEKLYIGYSPVVLNDNSILFNNLTTAQVMQYIFARIPANPL